LKLKTWFQRPRALRYRALIALTASTETGSSGGQGAANQVSRIARHLARAMEKLGLESRVALVRYTLERGWLHSA
jgi:hypothetical protein